MEPDKEAAEIVSQMFLWTADGNTVTKQEKKLRALQDSKRKLYERYALGEIDLDSYKAEKEKYDIAPNGFANFFVFRLTYACRTSRSCATVTLPRTPPPPRTLRFERRHHRARGTTTCTREHTTAPAFAPAPVPVPAARHFDTRVTLL